MKHSLPELPFAKNALEPHISAETLEYHWGKHHKAYLDKLNTLIQGTEYEQLPLEEIVLRSDGKIFNNAAQAWNHTFFWNCLTGDSKKSPDGPILDAIKRDFGSLEDMKKKFQSIAVDQFGSGWAWLVRKRDGSLALKSTSNAENPLRDGDIPIFVCDVWEHAYYIDYRNDRARFVQSIWNVVNWDFVQTTYEAAERSQAA
ncbi:MAG: superoxide dismutase [Bdellovibrionales bacterium GWB1_55_8]|nr:MAG: superoxide dismutase [Bdellovibrionales bacterium GWB1_55_8]